MLFRKWSVRAEPHSAGAELMRMPCSHLPLVDAVPAELTESTVAEGVNRRGLASLPRIR